MHVPQTIKAILKWTIISITGIIILVSIAYLIMDEPRPEGKPGKKAEQLAQNMAQALKQKAWDTTRIVTWTFMHKHHYIWDKTRNLVQVKWDNKHVLINPDHKSGKVVLPKGTSKSKRRALIKKAHAYFYNDSFWLCAPYKIFDEGTRRALVKTDSTKALMVTYTKGGNTPGDTYLWFMDETGRPEKVKMWVSIIPVGGVSFTWQNYQQLYSGAMVALNHKGALFDVNISGVRAGKNFQDAGIDHDPFTKWQDR